MTREYWMDRLPGSVTDIGVEGLKVVNIAPDNHIYDFFKSRHSGADLSQGICLDMIDVTTMDDTKRVYMQPVTESAGPR